MSGSLLQPVPAQHDAPLGLYVHYRVPRAALWVSLPLIGTGPFAVLVLSDATHKLELSFERGFPRPAVFRDRLVGALVLDIDGIAILDWTTSC